MTVLIGVFAGLAALVAASGRLTWVAAAHGLLPESLLWLTLPGGVMPAVRVVAALFAVVGATVVLYRVVLHRFAHRGALVGGAGVALTLVLGWLAYVPFPGAATVFEAWRTHYIEAREAIAPQVPFPEYYGPDLPEQYAWLSVTGFVSTTADGAIFFPRWTGLVDDAGGFWYVPDDTSPAGLDMWGLECSQPVELEPHWWSCGIRTTP